MWRCGTRVITSSSSPTSRVLVQPAPSVAPLAILTGATSWSVRTNKHIIFNDRFMFVRAIIVASDSTRADVNIGTNLTVAQIAQVTRFGAQSQFGIFQFHEITDMRLRR